MVCFFELQKAQQKLLLRDQHQQETMEAESNVARHSQGVQCSLLSLLVTTVAAAGVQGGAPGVPNLGLTATTMNLSIKLASATMESIITLDRFFCLDPNWVRRSW